jgi:hypothetical protein
MGELDRVPHSQGKTQLKESEKVLRRISGSKKTE